MLLTISDFDFIKIDPTLAMISARGAGMSAAGIGSVMDTAVGLFVGLFVGSAVLGLIFCKSAALIEVGRSVATTDPINKVVGWAVTVEYDIDVGDEVGRNDGGETGSSVVVTYIGD